MLYVQNNIFKMDSFELNKIIAAILMVALLVIGLGKITDSIFHVNKPKNPGYKVDVESWKLIKWPKRTKKSQNQTPE